MDNSRYQYQEYQNQDNHQQDPSQVQAPYDHSTTTQAYYDYTCNPHSQYQYYPPHNFDEYSYAYHPPQPFPDQQIPYYTVGNPGLDPASGAVNPVAPSQFPQFPESVHVSQMTVQTQIGQSFRRGGSKRGGRSSRGRGQSHSVYHGSRSEGLVGPYLGGEQGQVGGGFVTPHDAASTPSFVVPPAKGTSSAATVTASVSGSATSFQPPLRVAWCELCRVDCNTQEVLEQHKNGKKHKKNLKMHERLNSANKLAAGQENAQMPKSVAKPEVLQCENLGSCKEKELSQEDFPSLTVDNGNDVDQLKDGVEKSKLPVANSAEEPEVKSGDHRGRKRKKSKGRGGKSVRTNNGHRMSAEPLKPKVVIPFICELCSVRCESQLVFDSHLAGKKHLSKLKQFHGHQALYGEAGVQALYPPSFNAASSALIAQIQQGVGDPQVVLAQLLTYVLSQAQVPGLVGTQVPSLPVTQAGTMPVTAPVLEMHQHCNRPIQGSEAELNPGVKRGATVDAEDLKQHISSEFETPLIGGRKDVLLHYNLPMTSSPHIPGGNHPVNTATAEHTHLDL